MPAGSKQEMLRHSILKYIIDVKNERHILGVTMLKIKVGVLICLDVDRDWRAIRDTTVSHIMTILLKTLVTRIVQIHYRGLQSIILCAYAY